MSTGNINKQRWRIDLKVIYIVSRWSVCDCREITEDLTKRQNCQSRSCGKFTAKRNEWVIINTGGPEVTGSTGNIFNKLIIGFLNTLADVGVVMLYNKSGMYLLQPYDITKLILTQPQKSMLKLILISNSGVDFVIFIINPVCFDLSAKVVL